MRSIATLAATMALALPAAPGWAQSGDAYYGPPPVTYYAQSRDIWYDQPPTVVVPAEPRVIPGMKAPGDVLAALDRSGYRELSPMAQRGALYKLRAVNPRGDLVHLEISVYTGAIEREVILAVGRAAPLYRAPVPAVAPPPAPRPAKRRHAPAAVPEPAPDSESGPSNRDPLVVY